MTEEERSNRITGVRFSKVGKVYNFDASRIENVRLGDVVVVETSRGWQVGEVVEFVKNPEKPVEGSWKFLDRLATPKDLIQRQGWQAKEPDVVEACRKRVAELKLSGIKVIFSEYSFDGTRLTIFFSSDCEDKVELKSLRSDMQRSFAPAQVELRQIGPRDVAKYLGGMGACGLENRCCSRFITEFNSISIRMAKEQGLSLNPAKISGQCGRLMCCLTYEYDTYLSLRGKMPKIGKTVQTPNGKGKIVRHNPICNRIAVRMEDGTEMEVPVQDITVVTTEEKP